MKACGKNILVRMDIPDEKVGKILIADGPTKSAAKNRATVVSVGNHVDLPIKKGDRIVVRGVLSVPGLAPYETVIEDHVLMVLEKGDE